MPGYSLCKICGVLTTGSTGAAGLYWPNICQPCKNEEDAAALAQLTNQARVLNAALDMLKKPLVGKP